MGDQCSLVKIKNVTDFVLFRREAELEKLEELEEEEEEESQSSSLETNDGTAVSPADTKIVARSFRYMRRVPTIISYKPPEGNPTLLIV